MFLDALRVRRRCFNGEQQRGWGEALLAHIPTVIAFVSSALVAALLCLSARWHSRWTIDAPGSGPQKIHGNETPRVGGIAIAIGFVSALLLTKVGTTGGQAISQPIALIAALLVPFCAGLYEDITKTFGATMRLIATFIAAIIAHQLCGATMVRFDMPLLDAMLAASTVAPLLLTMFCVGGIAHAFNLSDGLNGLLGGLVIVACAVLGYVARAHGDVHIYLSACALAGATAGFLIFNFPRAKLFAGDSGAYFAGTAIALLAILLVARNANVTPWIAFVAVLYPFTDTTFSILRRAAQRRPIMQPDAEHLHSLLARKLRAGYIGAAHPIATLVIVCVTAIFSTLAVLFASSVAAVILCCVGFAATYVLAWFGCASERSKVLDDNVPSQLT
jgi:UDP-N-acetylmuramyl pentapeptide phosphotransferase/UDP-N-acetylglucosamine-1-phosphate transferase